MFASHKSPITKLPIRPVLKHSKTLPLAVGLSIITGTFTVGVSPTPAQVSSTLIAQSASSIGNVSVTDRGDGYYVARVLVKASPEVAWKVLTDYNNFSNFNNSNLASSQVVEHQGNERTVKQKSKYGTNITLEMVEVPQKQINFRLRSGDYLKSLQGTWQITAQSSDTVLITQSVKVEPNLPFNIGANVFYNEFAKGLAQSVNSVSNEISRRAQ